MKRFWHRKRQLETNLALQNHAYHGKSQALTPKCLYGACVHLASGLNLCAHAAEVKLSQAQSTALNAPLSPETKLSTSLALQGLRTITLFLLQLLNFKMFLVSFGTTDAR